MTQKRFRALVIDDEPDIRELVEMSLRRMGGDTLAAAGVTEAKELLANEPLDLCFTDMRMPDGSGFDVLAFIAQNRPELPVAVITAFGNVEDAVESLQAGAFDFVSKPVDIKALTRLVDKALKLEKKAATKAASGHELVGTTPAVETLRQLIDKLARSQAPVYISGESGTGKERVARLIHCKGPRADAPFVPVNCGAIPTELMESEFFGHLKGSFTGAVRDKEGLFMAAQGGTLFLDEIAELPQAMQVKLLRAIQERRIRPVGGEEEVAIDVRILCATHKPLAEMVAKGEFRQDLYYRINVIQAQVPALRDRREDIPGLCDSILAGLAEGKDNEQRYQLSDEAVAALCEYSFPGNIRELENILERAITLSENTRIEIDDLMLDMNKDQASLPTEAAASATQPSTTEDDGGPLTAHVQSHEKELIENALQKARYNKTRAAELLGISFRQLRYRIKKLGLE